jgi:hypothetical protein
MSVKNRSRALLVTLGFVCVGGYVACSSPPQYEGGGRHLDNEFVTNSSSTGNKDAGKDTSVPDTSIPDTSVGE